MGASYDALRQVAELNYDDSAEQQQYDKAVKALQECRELAATVQADPGMTGKSGAAASAWLKELTAALDEQEKSLGTIKTRHDLARAAMVQAVGSYSQLPTTLITPFENQIYRNEPEIMLTGVGMVTGAAYLSYLRNERDAARDAQAKQVLDDMNQALNQQADSITKPVEDDTSTPDGTNGPSGPSYNYSSPDGIKFGGAATPTNPSVVGGFLIGPIKTNEPTSPWRGWTPPTTGPGSPGHPITIICEGPPFDRPVNPTKITPQGPVGGYVPPGIDVNDPRWSTSYRAAGYELSGTATAGVIAGGVLGVGGAALISGAMSSGATLPALSALSLRAATSAGNAGALNGALFGQAGAGRAPAGGMLRGGGAANAVGAGGRAAAGGRGAGGRGATGANGAGRDGKGKGKKKRGRQLVGYDVVRLDEDVTAEVSNEAAAAGSSDALAPIRHADDGERW